MYQNYPLALKALFNNVEVWYVKIIELWYLCSVYNDVQMAQ